MHPAWRWALFCGQDLKYVAALSIFRIDSVFFSFGMEATHLKLGEICARIGVIVLYCHPNEFLWGTEVNA